MVNQISTSKNGIVAKAIALLCLFFLTFSSITPTQQAWADSEGLDQIAVGRLHSCRINSDQLVQCWGDNSRSQLQVPLDLNQVVQISSGDMFSCALESTGSVKCWGYSTDGATTPPANLGLVTQISAGSEHICAVSLSKVICWGRNFEKQASVPSNLGPAIQVSSGQSHTCALTATKKVTCWGLNSSKQSTPPKGLRDVTQISAGQSHTCALTATKKVTCWGLNNFGQSSTPKDLDEITSVVSGSEDTCVISATGRARCWGRNAYGQAPKDIPFENLSHIAVGFSHSCAITNTNQARCWGNLQDGRSDSPDFGPVTLGAKSVDAGGAFSCVVSTSYTARCIGLDMNEVGQIHKISLGDGHRCVISMDWSAICYGYDSNGQATVPSNLGAVKDLVTGDRHTCAITQTDNLRCWGGSPYVGQAYVPSDFGTVTQISAGGNTTCAVRSTGFARCIGDNNSGKATPPSNLGQILEIQTGGSNTCSVDVNHLVRCWGSNLNGQNNVPNDLGQVKTISVGNDQVCAITMLDLARCWGGQMYGQSTVPSDLGSVSMIDAGANLSCAVTTTQTVRCWGRLASNLNFREELKVYPVPLPSVSLSNLGNGLVISVSNVFTGWNRLQKYGRISWVATDALTGTELCRSITESCTAQETIIGANYKVNVQVTNESGDAPLATSDGFRNCASNPTISTEPSSFRPAVGEKVTITGFLLNLCPVLPNTIQLRTKPFGKSWSSWKKLSLSTEKTFTHEESFFVATKVQYRAINGTDAYFYKEDTFKPVRGNVTYTVSSSSNRTSQGFTQGGVITFSVKGPKDFNGTCRTEAATGYAFNFALTYMGSETKHGSFKLINGRGTGKLTARWNGEFSASVVCSSGAFPDDDFASSKTVRFRANF